MDVDKFMYVDASMQADTMNFVHQSVDTQHNVYVQQNQIGITAKQPICSRMLTSLRIRVQPPRGRRPCRQLKSCTQLRLTASKKARSTSTMLI